MTSQVVKVLLVDDDEEDYIIARDLFAQIEQGRYELEWLSSYEEALDEILKQRHHVYLLDYHLGSHDGLQLLGAALEAKCRAPMIMLTGQGGRDVDLKAMTMGAYDYLVKGQITSDMLERSLRYAMQHARSTNALRETVRISSALLTAISNLDRGVAISDPLSKDAPLIYVNDYYVQMTGYKREDLIGRNPRILQGVETSASELKRISEKLSRGEHYRGALINYRADGSPFINNLSIFPVQNNDGIVVQHIAICEPREYVVEE